MSGRAARVALRRHELARVIAAADPRRRRWRMLSLSNYTAHAVYDAGGGHVGHVVGTAESWWWALESGPAARVVHLGRTTDLADAMREAGAAACRARLVDRRRAHVRALRRARQRCRGRQETRSAQTEGS